MIFLHSCFDQNCWVTLLSATSTVHNSIKFLYILILFNNNYYLLEHCGLVDIKQHTTKVKNVYATYIKFS